MDLAKLKELLYAQTEEARVLADCLKNDGDTCSTSQRMCLINAIHEVDSVIAGITKEDIS